MDIKYRNEIKFKISKKMAEVLKQRLSLVMDLDSHSGGKDNTYHIRSIYFDDLDSSALYEKVDGVEYRRKYRIRIYNLSDKVIKLECKHKHNAMTFKESMTISKAMTLKLISADIDDVLFDDLKGETFYDEYGMHLYEDSLLKRFLVEMKLRQLKPSIIVDYHRLAYTYPISEVRVTFDYNVKSGNYSDDIFGANVPTFGVINDDELVLEVKFNEILPAQISAVLSTIPMYRQAVSKFAICRSTK